MQRRDFLDKEGIDSILVFIDSLSKAPISIPCKKTMDAEELAKTYLIHCFREIGFLDSITLDRDPRIISDF